MFYEAITYSPTRPDPAPRPVLPGRMDEERYVQTRDALGARLDALAQTEPIAFRKQNGGAYEIPALTLREDVAPERTGFAAHVA